jgi:aspartate/methionine/tyrosine aminotransferase
MSELERINHSLRTEAPAVWGALTPLGRRIAFPRDGILAQTEEARSVRFNATIGQITDGRGGALPLASMAATTPELDPGITFLYSPQVGQPSVRDAWHARQRRLSGSTAPLSRPVVTHGLTQGLGLMADLFVDDDTTVILPSPSWENYRLMFGMRSEPRFVTWPFFGPDGIHVEALAQALASVKGRALLLLNIPGNPTGFSPTVAQAARIAEVVAAHPHPLVVLCDDAYEGMVWEPGVAVRSVYWDIAERADPERTAVFKLDGVTKELFFFAGRVGFLGHNQSPAAAEALQSKMAGLCRGSVGSPPGPSQAMTLAALQSPTLEVELQAQLGLLGQRYVALRDALRALDTPALRPLPFNSGCFCLIGVDPGIDANALRQRLIREFDVGLIAVPEVNALRLAYCSAAAEDLPELVARLGAAAGR